MASETPVRKQVGSEQALVATLIGAAVAVLPALLPGNLLDMELSYHRIGQFIGGIVFGIAIAYGVAWLLGIRRASERWQTAALVVIVLLGLLAPFLKSNVANVRADQALSEAQAGLDRAIAADEPMPIRQDSKPAWLMLAVIRNGALEDSAMLAEEMRAAGVAGFAAGVASKSDPMLTRCADMAALAARVREHYVGRVSELVNESRHIGEEAVAGGALPQRVVDTVVEKAVADGEAHRERLEMLANASDTHASFCGMLRDKPWSLRDGKPAFDNPRDAEAANVLAIRMETLVAQDRRLAGEADAPQP